MPSQKTSTGLVVLAVLAIFALVFLRPSGDVESLVPVQTQARLSLIQSLENVRPLAGFPGNSSRWIFVHQNPYINRAEGGAGVYSAPTGVISWDGVSIHPEAVLSFRVSVDPMGMPPTSIPSPYRYRFMVEVHSEGKETQVYEGVFQSESPKGDQSPLIEVPLTAFVGRKVDIVFCTEDLSAPQEPAQIPDLLPCWRDPVVESLGQKMRVGDLAMNYSCLVEDLIAKYAMNESPSQDEVLVERELSTLKETMKPLLSVEPEFDTGPGLHVDGGGARPSFVFASSGSLEFPLEVPEGAVLKFSLGQREFSRDDREPLLVGGGRVTLVINGEDEQTYDLPRGGKGWSDVQFSLDAYSEIAALIEWRVELDPTPSQVIIIPPASGNPEDETVRREVLVREIAIARPRIVTPKKATRRLSGDDRPNVILIVAETLRSDHLGCYNREASWTPNIDALAARGIRYESCASASSWTWPSTASILTGLYPESHGVTDEEQSFLLDKLVSLPEILQVRGISTAAFVTNSLISPRKNFDQGFEKFLMASYANAHQVGEMTKDWIEDHKDLQHFVYLHYYEPHDPCEAPGDFREKHIPDGLRGQSFSEVSTRVIDRYRSQQSVTEEDKDFVNGAYRGEIEFLDQQIGQLMDWLADEGLDRKTYVIFTADHGEEFWDHGNYGHGSFLYQESLAVPLIIVGPGIPPNRVCRTPVENRRLFSTVLEQFGIEGYPTKECPPLPWKETPHSELVVSSTAKGILNLANVLSGDPERIKKGLTTLIALRKGPWKLICRQVSPAADGESPDGQELLPMELFHLDRDPKERENLLLDDAQVVAEILQAGTLWLQKSKELAVSNPRGDLSAETHKALQQLGYEHRPK